MSDEETSESASQAGTVAEIVLSPIQILRNKALEQSGLSYDRAFKIDELELGEAIGEYHMTALVEKFYSLVYASEDEHFK